MSARSQALVPLSAEQQAAWRAVAETEKRRHQGNTLAEYPYAGAFFRCLNGSRRISLSDLRFFMPSLTAEELRGNRSQWLYAVDGGLRRNRRNFRYPSFKPATNVSRSISSLLFWKV